jgi:hypothetical protein
MISRLLSVAILSTAAALAADPALLRLVPPDSSSVIGLDVEQGKNSPLGRYILSRAKDESQELDRWIRSTGFDPRRDLREVYVVNAAARQNSGMFIARGTFDQSRILAAAKAEGGQALVYEGLNVVTGKSGREDHWVAFLDSSTAVAGHVNSVKTVIARRAPNAPAAPSYGQLLELANRYDTWIFSTDPASSFKAMPKNQNGELLRSVEQVSAGAKFGANVNIDGRAVTRSERDATALQDVIRFLASMIQANSEGNARDAANLLNSLQLSTRGNVMTLSLSIPQTDLERLLDQAQPGRPRRAPQSIE